MIFRRALFSVLLILPLSLVAFLPWMQGVQAGTLATAPSLAALKGHHILLDPGHGGWDPGFVNRDGVQEKTINLQIALLLAEMLRKNGATVTLTRTSDRSLSTPSHPGFPDAKHEDLAHRARLGKAVGAEVVLSIHQNSFSDPRVHGPQLFLDPQDPAATRLAGLLQERLNAVAMTQRAPIDARRLHMVHDPGLPAVVVETGFLSNPEEAARLRDPNYQRALVQAMVDSLAAYFCGETPSDEKSALPS
ncbi:MAG: N-acetylmuramoyl-L-alanine amidase [Firmicutes bacterium]|nr:N-acetylmuramoyl-L-alanine amidase [Bacillota bacterium]